MVDRLQLGATLRDGVIEPVVVLERLAQGSRGFEARGGGGRFDLGPQLDDGGRGVHQLGALVEPPGAHRIADR